LTGANVAPSKTVTAGDGDEERVGFDAHFDVRRAARVLR
jgi:hypothetical protein